MDKFDAIVVGAGHAGVESAKVLANKGFKTLLLTLSLDAISFMACNPNVGGTAKGHLVCELTALGGVMGKIADKATIQSRMLNLANGPAVHSLRAQVDKNKYHRLMKLELETTENLFISEDECAELIIEDGVVKGIKTALGRTIFSDVVVLATGVYLKSRIIIGEYERPSGPSSFRGANLLTESLIKAGLPIRRFKTGTPPRLLKSSIDFSVMAEQKGDEVPVPFSRETESVENDFSCYLTYTNEKTHEIILSNLDRAPLFNGMIESVGPRYCPSIETKVVRFSDKDRHQLFVEPEGADTEEMYLQGLSTSLPYDIQEQMVHSIKGLENAVITRYAYAIEYDCIDPLALYPTLETKAIKNLFTAGQINGSSGYEEAAVQGFVAGINAALRLEGKDGYVFTRDSSYIGVLVDDLVTKGTEEPYRMMTARAEYRLSLRQDNADFRLTEIGKKLGSVSEEQYEKFLKRKGFVEEAKKLLKKNYSPKVVNPILERVGETLALSGVTGEEFIRRKGIDENSLCEIDSAFCEIPIDALRTAVIDVKYEGYTEKERKRIEETKRLEEIALPIDLDYEKIEGLRIEARQKLAKIKPLTLGQASRISGVSPADITVLLIERKLKK